MPELPEVETVKEALKPTRLDEVSLALQWLEHNPQLSLGEPKSRNQGVSRALPPLKEFRDSFLVSPGFWWFAVNP